MAEMSVSMIMRLVDQFTKPAKEFESELEKMKRATTALNEIQKGPMRSSQWDDALKTVSKRRQELEAQQKVEAETAAAVQASASKQVSAIRELEAVREQAARATIASERAELAAVQQAEAGKLRAVEVSAREQAAAVRSLERQRSRAHQKMVVEADMERRNSTHGGMGGAGAVLGLGAVYKGEQFAREGLKAYREWSDTNAIMRPVGDLTATQQAAMKAQQQQLGVDSRYSPVKIAEAQKLLLERGIAYDMVAPYVAQLVNYASAMNIDLPQATKTIEAHMFSTGKFKDIHSPEEANRIIQRSTDLNTKMGKLGMSDADISGAWEYGGLPGRQAGLSDETLGAIFTLMKRNQIAGTAAGVAVRALAAKLVSPTGTGIQSLAALGITYSDFVKPGGGLSSAGINAAIDRKYFKKLTPEQVAAINQKLADPEIVTDRDKFIGELKPLIASAFKTKKGEVDQQKASQIEKLLAGVFDKAVQSVDSEGLLRAIMSKHPELAALNGIFGFQQGGREGAFLQNPKEFEANRQKLVETPVGFALQIATERLQSFDGALKQLEGSIETLQIRIASSFDNEGKGGGFLTQFANGLTLATNQLIKLPDSLSRAATELATLAGVAVAAKSMGLVANAVGLGGAATSAGAFLGPMGWLGIGAIVAKAATDRMEESRLTPKESDKTYTSDILLGLSQILRGNFRWRDPQYEDHPAGAPQAIAPQADTSQLDQTKTKADEARQTLDLLNAKVTPTVDLTSLERLVALIAQANSGLSTLGARAASAKASFSPSSGALHDGPEAR